MYHTSFAPPDTGPSTAGFVLLCSCILEERKRQKGGERKMEGVKNLFIPLEPTIALRYLSPCLSLLICCRSPTLITLITLSSFVATPSSKMSSNKIRKAGGVSTTSFFDMSWCQGGMDERALLMEHII